jgi:DNA-binding GntR family transcriptional regulator
LSEASASLGALRYALGVARRAGSESLAVDVSEQLRRDIFNRRLAPGERLKPVELGERFGVSVGVMREALGLLAAQSLVQIERNRGFHVITLSQKDLEDLTVARKLNEGAALRLSIERGGVAWESEVLAAHHRLAKAPVYLPGGSGAYNPEWGVHHAAFHAQLVRACGNTVILDICERLSDAAQVYRAWAGDGETGRGGIVRDVEAEHRALMQAALSHDADLAVRLFEEHVDRTRAILLDLEYGFAGPSTPEV